MARIMIVDDSAFMRMTIKEALQKAGHEVVAEAENLNDALKFYQKEKPDLVTMDILMKDSGVECVKKIKEVDPKAKIIVISVLSEQEGEVVEAIQNGAMGLVTKPINREVLSSEVGRVLNKKI